MKTVTPSAGRFGLSWLTAILFVGVTCSLAHAEAPPAPASLNAHSGGDQEVALAWAASPGATSYTIFRSNTQNDTGIKQVAENITETSYKATGLRNDLTYYFRVKAVSAGGTSAFSREASATTQITKQALPEGVYTLTPRNAPQLRLQKVTLFGISGPAGIISGPTQPGKEFSDARTRMVDLAEKAVQPAQQWIVTSLDHKATYRLSPAADPTQCLEAGGSGVLWAEYKEQPSQQWMLTPVSGGFRLTPVSDPARALNASGAEVNERPKDDTPAQTWIILPLPEGGPDGMPDPGTKYVPEGYKLVFGDEFNGDQIDLAKWETLAPYSQPHLNKELENYLPEAVTVKDGICVLRAEPHESTCSLAGKQPAPHCLGVHHWRSGAITSRPTFRHAYYEARLKLPQGVGMWPAFWATSATRWPPEWDFLEVQNTVGTLYQYMHPTKGAKMTWVRGAIGRDSVYPTGKGMPNPYDGYVIYGAEVTPRGVKLWINGVLTAEWAVSADTIDPMWVNCELAVGDSWAGNPDATTPKKNDMLIDYVRVYQSPVIEAEVQAMLAAQPAPAAPKK